jgi:hypothetical protein
MTGFELKIHHTKVNKNATKYEKNKRRNTLRKIGRLT